MRRTYAHNRREYSMLDKLIDSINHRAKAIYELVDEFYDQEIWPVLDQIVTNSDEGNNKNWKNKLQPIRKSLGTLVFALIDNKDYDTYNELINKSLKDLARVYLKNPRYYTNAKNAAVSLCEEILYKYRATIPADILANLYFHLANFHSNVEHDSWRSRVYLNALNKLKTTYSIELNKKVQKPNENSEDGLKRFVGGYPAALAKPSTKSVTKLSPASLGIVLAGGEEDDEALLDITLTGSEEDNNYLHWKKLNKLSILTGANGVGKTMFLNGVSESLKQKIIKIQKEGNAAQIKDHYSLRIQSELTGARKVHGDFSHDFTVYYVQEYLDKFLEFQDYIWGNLAYDSRSNFNAKLALAVIDRLICGEVEDIEKAKEKSKIIEIAETLSFSENLIVEPLTLIENIFKQHLDLFLDDLFDDKKRINVLKFMVKKIEEIEGFSYEYLENFRKVVEELFNYEWSTYRKKEYDKIISNKQNKAILGLFAAHIYSCKDLYHSYCQEYLKNTHEITPPNEILAKMSEYLPGYEIQFGWDRYQSRGNSIVLVNSADEALKVGKQIPLYKNEDNIWVYRAIRNSGTKYEHSEEIFLEIDLDLHEKYYDKTEEKLTYDGEAKIYEQIFSHGHVFLGKYRLKFKKEEQEIAYRDLSSGELTAIKLVLWAYISRGVDYRSRDENPKIKTLLLDEVDKHLDSKLTRSLMNIIKNEFASKGVQVFMTTHRPDTLALVPNDESKIYTLKRAGDVIEVVETHPLLAMFRLTGNLREITGHHHVVYTESRNDALFYEGVYRTLMQYCNYLRENKEIADWQVPDSSLAYLLSRRSQFSFMSVSAVNDGSGGCAKVIEYIASDITAYKNLERGDYKKSTTSSRKLDNVIYSDFRLSSPYGILDNDFGKEYKFEIIGGAELQERHSLSETEFNTVIKELGKKRAIILERHSLENYIFDPFILCSTLTYSELRKFVNKIDTNMLPEFYKNQMIKDFEQITLDLKKIPFTQEDAENILKQYYSIFSRNKNCIDTSKKRGKATIDKLDLLKQDIETVGKTCAELLSFINQETNNLGNDKYEEIAEKLSRIATKNKCPDLRNKFAEASKKDNKSKKSSSHGKKIASDSQEIVYSDGSDAIVMQDLKDVALPSYESISKKDSYIIIDGKDMVEASYPTEITGNRGHDLGMHLFYGWDLLDGGGCITIAKEITNIVVERIYSNGLAFIPLDLAQTLFQLNQNLRTHVRELLKPDPTQVKKTWAQEFEPLGKYYKPVVKSRDESEDDRVVSGSAGECKEGEADPAAVTITYEESNRDSEKKAGTTVAAVYQLIPYNLLLDYILEVNKLVGKDARNNFIELGQDPDILEQIMDKIHIDGIESTLKFFFDKPIEQPILLKSASVTSEQPYQTQDYPKLEFMAGSLTYRFGVMPLKQYAYDYFNDKLGNYSITEYYQAPFSNENLLATTSSYTITWFSGSFLQMDGISQVIMTKYVTDFINIGVNDLLTPEYAQSVVFTIVKALVSYKISDYILHQVPIENSFVLGFTSLLCVDLVGDAFQYGYAKMVEFNNQFGGEADGLRDEL